MFTLAGQGFARALLRMPRYGAALAEADLQAIPTPDLVVGQRATLAIGDWSGVGTLLAGGPFGGIDSFGWIAGGNGWSNTIPAHTYRDDNGILLSTVLADLAVAAGELGAVLDGIPDRILGYAWTRPTGIASDMLRALVGDAWWIAADGITHAGPRPTPSIAPTDLTVEPFDPALRRGTVVLAGDGVAQLVPGATLTAQGLPGPLAIAQLEVHARPNHVEAVLWGERTGPELAASVLGALARRFRFAATAPMRVTATSGARSTVEPADARAVDLDGHPFLDAIYGIPGASAVLANGATVVIGWPGMDPGSPMVVGFLPGTLPLSLALAAQNEIDATAALVQLGAPGGHFVVVDNGLAVWLQSVRTQLIAAGHDPGVLPIIAATKVKAT